MAELMAATPQTARRVIDDARATLMGDWGDYDEEDNDARLREAGAMAYLANAEIAYVNGNWKLAIEKAEKSIEVHGGN